MVTGKKNIGKTIDRMIKEKKTVEEVFDYAKKKKWNDREVRLYYFLYTAQSYTKSGYSIDEIESMSLDSGWPNELVQIVVNKLR